jgi:peptidyl-prolyl cis-trans isomerase SurA
LLRDKKLVLYIVETSIKKEGIKQGARKDSLVKYFEAKGIKVERIHGSVSSNTNTTSAIVKVFVRSSNKKAIESHYNTTDPLALQVTEGLFQEGENTWVDKADKKEGTYSFEKEGRYYLVIIDKIESPRAKELEECRGLAISDYQNFLEKKWLTELKAKYPVTINEEELKKLVKTKTN